VQESEDKNWQEQLKEEKEKRNRQFLVELIRMSPTVPVDFVKS
jgi:hypothetical protein